MLVSINWLKKYISLEGETPESLAEKITKSGIEVDAIHYVTEEKSENITIGYVEACEKHPDADKLNVCQVDVGEEENLQIICGASNIAQGQKVVVAKPGAVLPNDFKIKKVKLRGIESNGMICSLEELSVQEDYIPEQFKEGIAVLPADAKVGSSVEEILPLDDAILEFDLTPNRADALSMIGVAYEVAAILDRELTLPEPTIETTNENVTDYITVRSEDADLCPYYAAFMVKDVQVEASPLWLQNALLAAGIRPINNVVDITNYVLMEYGQPLHAFDYDLLGSKEIVVRRAAENEKILTLDDKERTLTNENLLITNGKEGIALAGVMGGANTEVNDDTKNVLIEAAYFDPQTVRKAVNETGLRSDASTRFEKGVDPERVREAGLRACELLSQYAGGKLVDDAAEYNEMTPEEQVINVPTAVVNHRLGTDISTEEMGEIFRKLRFHYEQDGETFIVTVPTRRGDITIFEDMLEEVARIYGYDHLPYTLPVNASTPGGLTKTQALKRHVKSHLQAAGLSETIMYSLTDEAHVNTFLSPEIAEEAYVPIPLHSPMSEAHSHLRLSLIPEMLKVVSYNLARKQHDIGLFEIGSVYLSKEEEITEQPAEKARLAGALTGLLENHRWKGEKTVVDFYVAKGIVESLFAYLNMEVTYHQAKLPEMHPGRCATIAHKGHTIGFLGQVHPFVAKQLDLKETYVFDIDMEYIFEVIDPVWAYEPVAKYPAVSRDVAFVVSKEVISGDIQQTIEETGGTLVKNVEIFDVYSGENLAETEKSLAYAIEFQDKNKTLTDEEVDTAMDSIMNKIAETYKAHVRTE